MPTNFERKTMADADIYKDNQEDLDDDILLIKRYKEEKTIKLAIMEKVELLLDEKLRMLKSEKLKEKFEEDANPG
jgi:ferredoxin-fold anticodon binding domain-containing protein